MEHHATWLDWLSDRLGGLSAKVSAASGWPLNDEGKTWLSQAPIGVAHVFGALIVLGVLVAMALSTRRYFAARQSDVAPSAKPSVGALVEIVVEGMLESLTGMMGRKDARFFLPLLGTCFLFILVSNLLGLIPGFVPPTDSLNTTLPCSLVIVAATHFYGLKVNGIDHIKHLFGPVRGLFFLPIMLLMFVIETFSHIAVRPGSLALRLMANMFADHMVLGIFHSLSPVASFLVPIPIYVLGMIVCCVQALVFSLLSAVYISMAIERHDHAH